MDTVCTGSWDVALYTDGEEVLAVWPYQYERKLGVRILRNPLLTPYLGPLWISGREKTKDWIKVLQNKLPEPGFIQFTMLPGLNEADQFALEGIGCRQRVTYLVDLAQTEARLWEQMHPKRRNAIRKAQSDLEVAAEDLQLDLLLVWHKASFAEKKQAYPYSISFFRSVTTAAKQHHAARAYSAKDKEGNPIAQAWFVFDQRCMYCLLTATPPQTHRGAVALLIWHALLEARRMGLAVFDFEGSMDPGIAHFFQRFGGEKVFYAECSATHSAIWRWKQKFLG